MTEFKGDKRSKAFKEWKKNHEKASSGLGDTVEKITKATGIKKAVKFLAGEDCKCDARQQKLNSLFSYEKPNCLTENEFNYLQPLIGKLNNVSPTQQKELLDIYNRVFNDNRTLTGCSSCFLNGVWKKLEAVFNEYK